MARYPLHEKALEWARSELRHGVREDPPGSNTGQRIVTYQRQTWLGGTRWPWCVAFFISAWQLGARRKLPYRGAGAYLFLDWAKTAGWAVPLEHAIPGDGVVFNVGTGHMAILAEPYAATAPLVRTVDGNVSDRVDTRSRHGSLVRGCVRVPEDPARDPAPPRKPVYEVVTSASGHSKVVYVSGQRAVTRKLGELLNRYGGVTIRTRKRPT